MFPRGGPQKQGNRLAGLLRTKANTEGVVTMFSLTTNAAARIRQSAVEGGMEELALRVAARREADGSITYGMGFDEAHEGEHPALLSDGVT